MVERIRRYYRLGLYTEEMLERLVEKGVITEEDYRAIIGEV